MSSALKVPCWRSAVRIGGGDERKHRRTVTISSTVLIVEHVRQTKRVAKFVYCNTVQIYRTTNSVDLCRVNCEAKSVADLGVELHVVIENRSRFVEAGGKLDVAVIVDVLSRGNRTRNVRVGVTIKSSRHSPGLCP